MTEHFGVPSLAIFFPIPLILFFILFSYCTHYIFYIDYKFSLFFFILKKKKEKKILIIF